MPKIKPYKLDQVAIRLVKEPPLYSAEPVNTPEAAVRILSNAVRSYDREVMCIVNLQTDLKPINMNICSMGSLNASIANPREILKSAILSNAAGVILVHNHPSGALHPSKEDIAITDRMHKVFSMMDIQLLDHTIIGRDDRIFSFKARQIMPTDSLHYTTDMDSIFLGDKTLTKRSLMESLGEAKVKYSAGRDGPKGDPAVKHPGKRRQKADEAR